jgi:zinc transport system substrate-binding protein
MLKTITAIFFMILTFSNNANAEGKRIKIAVSIKPIHSIVTNISYGVFEPDLILDDNTSPHIYSLKPSDAQKIQDADIIILVSKELETFLQKPTEFYKDSKTIIELVKLEGIKLRNNRNNNLSEVSVQGLDEHEATENDPKYIDPHIWLSPKNAIIIAEHMANVLSEKDPDNSYIYKQNFSDFKNKLDKQDILIKEKLAPYADTPFIVFHDAYQYFDKHYKLNYKGYVTQPSGDAIGAKRLKEIEEIISREKIACIFSEPQFSDTYIKNIADTLHIRINSLDPDGYGIESGKNAYFDILNNIANNIESCLKG